MRRQIDHQTQFISSLMGGPGGLSNDVLMRVHAPLGISKKEFVEIAGLLEEALFEARQLTCEYLIKALATAFRLLDA